MFLKAALKLALLFVLQICPTLEDCSDPPHISNGDVTYESTTKGSNVRYSCHPGYALSGHPILTCTDTGWSRVRPQCIEKSCGSPGEILNGWYNATGNTFGAKVTFYCDEGYQISGRNYRLCETDGWSGDVPSCQPVTCDDLPSIVNGYAPNAPNSEYWESGSVAKYSCIGDYSLIGAKSLICLPSGRWSDDPPTCREVRCFVPDAPTNGRIRSGARNVLKYEEEVLFECDHGYELVGSNLIKCNENSQFSSDPPTCRFNGCKKPRRIASGWISNHQEIYSKHETVTFVCRSGYKLFGSETLRCVGNNVYDKPFPECRAIRCQSPSPIWNGNYAPKDVFTISYSYGAIITYTCDKGFKLEGSSQSRCGDNSVFNPPPPTCRRVYCYSPTMPDNGNFRPKQQRYGYHQEITFSCYTGYELVGSRYSRCEDEGTFNPSPPICRKVQCEQPRNLNNIIIQPNQNIYDYEDHVTFSCHPGYTPKGSTESLCVGRDTFDPPPPICKKVQCEQPRNLNNIIIQPNQNIYDYEDHVTFSCHPGYTPKGSTESVCVGRDTFDPPPPICKKDDSEWTISKTAYGKINTIIQWSHEIINEKRDIIQKEHQLLQKEESILSKYQAIVRELEILINNTSIPKAA